MGLKNLQKNMVLSPELGKSLFALERTLISGANERFKKKSDERTDKIQS